MGWLTWRETPRRMFEDGVRWVELIKHRQVNAEDFARWAMHSPAHMDAFRQAWLIWHDVRALSPDQREHIERLARTQ